MKEAYGTDEYAGWMYEIGRATYDATLLTNQLLCLLAIIGWTSLIMIPFFWFLNAKNWLRTDVLEEVAGLDVNYMNETHEAKEEAQEDLNAYQTEVKKARKRRESTSNRLNESRHSTASIISTDSAV